MSIALIVPCAGTGTRAGDTPKQLQLIDKEAVFIHSIRPFLSVIDTVIIVCNQAIRSEIEVMLEKSEISAHIVLGGESRMASVHQGLLAARGHEFVLIHDAARPNLDPSIAQQCVSTLQKHGDAVLTAIPCSDTLKHQSKDAPMRTIDRTDIYLAQTPQGFALDGMTAHYEEAIKQQRDCTDDISICEWKAIPVRIVNGSRANIKYTYPEDLALLRKLMA